MAARNTAFRGAPPARCVLSGSPLPIDLALTLLCAGCLVPACCLLPRKLTCLLQVHQNPHSPPRLSSAEGVSPFCPLCFPETFSHSAPVSYPCSAVALALHLEECPAGSCSISSTVTMASSNSTWEEFLKDKG